MSSQDKFAGMLHVDHILIMVDSWTMLNFTMASDGQHFSYTFELTAVETSNLKIHHSSSNLSKRWVFHANIRLEATRKVRIKDVEHDVCDTCSAL